MIYFEIFKIRIVYKLFIKLFHFECFNLKFSLEKFKLKILQFSINLYVNNFSNLETLKLKII